MSSIKSNQFVKQHAGKILDSIADGVFTVNENLIITYFNRSAERIIGISSNEATGQYCFDVLKANICEKSCPIRCAIKGGADVTNKKVNILRNDGRMIAISISTSSIQNENGEIVGGVETFRDMSTIEELKREIRKSYSFQDIVSKNIKIVKIFDILPNISESNATVLIEGPSGSGKELFARAIHNISPRKKGPFIAINCGALPDTLLESELFGYVKGAFTDARKDKPGRFALAEKGTLFLDEVDSLPKQTQVKLLRVIQEREYEPLGAVGSVKADIRLIAAANVDLKEKVYTNQFRDDLYFRLNVVKIRLPHLAERRDDIPLLVDHIIEKFNALENATVSGASDKVISVLMAYDFPGNIRELENIIEYAFLMTKTGEIELHHLPPELTVQSTNTPVKPNGLEELNEHEKDIITKLLVKLNWNRHLVARELGIHRSTLWRKMQRFGIKPTS